MRALSLIISANCAFIAACSTTAGSDSLERSYSISQDELRKARFGCGAEVGTTISSVGTWITATPPANAAIRPGDCLISSNSTYMVRNQPESNFVVYPTSNPSASTARWNSNTIGYTNAWVIIQNDGHFVTYPSGRFYFHSGSVHGNSDYALAPTPKETSTLDDYFLIMQDNGVLALFRGSSPGQHRGLIWTSEPLREIEKPRKYCVILRNAIGEPVKRIDTPATDPVRAYGTGRQQVEEWNRTAPAPGKATTYTLANGECV